MQYMQAQAKDKAAVMELWAKDFESYEPYYSWYFNTIYRDERTYLLKGEGQLIAAAQLAPYKMQLRGKATDIDFIVGVITEPAYRGKGMGAQLMRELMNTVKEKGLNYSVLVPVCPEFYTKLGYSCCYEDNVWDIPIERLRAKRDFAGSWQKYEIDTAIPMLQEIYIQMSKQLNGCMLRSERNWRNFLTEICNDKGEILIYTEGEEAKAYMLMLPKPEKDTEKLWLREMGVTALPYRNACFNYIKKNYPADKIFYWSAPSYDDSYLALPLQDGIYRRAGAMIYCHDFETALAELEYNINADITIEIENAAKLRLLTRGNLSSATPYDGECDIKLDRDTMTKLIFGFRSAEELHLNGHIEASAANIEILDRLFPKQNNWLSEQT